MKNINLLNYKLARQLAFQRKGHISKDLRNLRIEEDSCKIIIFLVLAAVELQITLNQIEEK